MSGWAVTTKELEAAADPIVAGEMRGETEA
jgi:hypothetical protein